MEEEQVLSLPATAEVSERVRRELILALLRALVEQVGGDGTDDSDGDRHSLLLGDMPALLRMLDSDSIDALVSKIDAFALQSLFDLLPGGVSGASKVVVCAINQHTTLAKSAAPQCLACGAYFCRPHYSPSCPLCGGFVQ